MRNAKKDWSMESERGSSAGEDTLRECATKSHELELLDARDCNGGDGGKPS